MKTIFSLLISLVALALPHTSALAQSSCDLVIEATLTDLADAPFDGTVDVDLVFYDEAVVGAALECRTLSGLLVADGSLVIRLDRCAVPGPADPCGTVPLDALFRFAAEEGSQLWTGLSIDDGAELTPRIELGGVPFASWATRAGSAAVAGALEGFDASEYQRLLTESCPDGSALSGFGGDGTPFCTTVGNAGACGAGEFVQAISSSGEFVCVTDVGTEFATGDGLVLTGGVLGVDTTLQRRVNGTCDPGEAITMVHPDGSVTCESAGSSYTAGAGLTLASTTFAVDFSDTQARVTGSCPEGSSIRAINADGTVACETDDDTATEYTGGDGITVDGTVIRSDGSGQARVDGTCPSGQSVRVINSDGSVLCETDDDTTYSAGTGITLTGTTLSVDSSTTQRRVTESCPDGQAIRVVAADGTVTCVDAGGTVVLTAANYRTVGIASGDDILLGELIALASDFDGLEAYGIQLRGVRSVTSGFTGSGTQVLTFANDTVVRGLSFRDIVIEGNDLVFEDCDFSGAISFEDGGTQLLRGRVNAVFSGATVSVIDGAEVESATIPRLDDIRNSTVSNSTLGAPNDLGTLRYRTSVESVVNNRLDDSTVHIFDDAIVSGNHSDATLFDLTNCSGFINVSGNNFQNLQTSSGSHFNISVYQSYFTTINITGNNFEIDSSGDRHILISGAATGSYQIVQISQNNFMKGDRAIQYSGSLPLWVKDNLVRVTTIGVSSGGDVVVSGTVTF